MAGRNLALIAGCCAAEAVWGGWNAYQFWRQHESASEVQAPADRSAGVADGAIPVRLSRQARENLGLTSKPLKTTTYWRTIEVPGAIVDRPGVSDRGVTAPVTGTVIKVHAFPGDMVEPGSPLFTLRLISESLHASQLELFKATKEIDIARAQVDRISPLAESGGIPKAKIVELENQIERLNATVQAYRQDLQARGLPSESIEAAASGEFATEFVVRAPEPSAASEIVAASRPENELRRLPFSFEMQTLRVELGEQVEAGQVLCTLADHRSLLIEGRGFKDDMSLVQTAARNGWKVAVDYDTPESGDWPPSPDELPIDRVANTIDEESRTFSFTLILKNQGQAYTREGVTRLLWRFRPGTRVRLHVPVDKLDNVFVVPQQAVVREGPEAYVFRQNGDFFDRRPVHVLHEDRLNVVLANDGSVRAGFYVAQSGAASLNRVLKAQSASGAPAGVHVHADGTVHEAH